MIISLKLIISCNVLGFKESFQGTCFDHAFSKVCQYATTYEKNYKGLRYLSIEVAQGDLQKCIICPKKWRMGMQKWENACVKRSSPKEIEYSNENKRNFYFY